MSTMPDTRRAAAAQEANIPLSAPTVGDDELAAVASVLDSGWMAGQGPRCTALEAGFTELTGCRHAIAVANCTAGLHLALAALDIGPGDEVIVADYSFVATGHSVLFVGAEPVFVDVDPATGTLDPELISGAVTPRTKAIIVVDALGIPADLVAIEAIARELGVYLVEDAACAAGGTVGDRACGSFGDIGVFSLHARKGITCGEGGVVVTSHDRISERIRQMSCFGMESAFARNAGDQLALPTFPELGYNYKLSDVLAAVAGVQLGRLAEFLAVRRDIAARYRDGLADLDGVTTPEVPADRAPTWQTYALTLDSSLDRDAAVVQLRQLGIGSNIGTYAMHQQPVYRSTSVCPVSASLAAQHLAIPMYSHMTGEQVDRVIAGVRQVVRDLGR